MSGSAGLSPSRNRKPEGSTLSGYARNLRKECVGLVAGQAVLTADITTVDADGDLRRFICHCLFLCLRSALRAASAAMVVQEESANTKVTGRPRAVRVGKRYADPFSKINR